MKSQFRNWQDVRVFLAVMREGSTLAASRLLDMAQPTVARRIDVLEHETGLCLFTRDTRGFHPTDGARALLPLAEALEQAADKLAETAFSLRHDRTKPIRITAGRANFTPNLARILSAFSEIHPDVRFELLPSYEVLDLRAGEADIALRLTLDVSDPELICRKISDAKFSLYASKRYIESYGAPCSLDDLDGHRFIAFHNNKLTTTIYDWLSERVRPEQIVSVTKDADALHTAIQSGLGIGICNVGLARDMDDLVPCFDPPEEFNVPHLMLISPEAYRRPEVRAFTEFFAPRYAEVFRVKE